MIFTEAEFNKLVYPIFNLALPRYNIYRIILLVVKYGPRDAMGLGFKNLFVTQSISKLTMFIEERDSNSLSNHLVNTNLEAAIINVGIGRYYLFSLDYDAYHYLLPPIWIKSL